MTERKLEQFEKLNIGSGKNFLEDFWNCDINPDFKPDILSDMLKLEFPNETFQSVLISDCLDHVNPVQAKTLLRKIFGWLKPNGTLTLHTPNLAYIALLIHREENSALGQEALRWLYGSNGEGTTAYWSNVIRWCYSPKSLSRILEDLGFTVLSVNEDCGGYGFTLTAAKKVTEWGMEEKNENES